MSKEIRTLDESVLLDLIDNWLDINKYYHPDSKNNSIPISELKEIIKSCPTAGEDSSYIRSKRLTAEYIKGRNEVLSELSMYINNKRTEE